MATPIKVLVPDIGGFEDVDVIDVLVKDGQQIEKETPLGHPGNGKGGHGCAGARRGQDCAGQAQDRRQGIGRVLDPDARAGGFRRSAAHPGEARAHAAGCHACAGCYARAGCSACVGCSAGISCRAARCCAGCGACAGPRGFDRRGGVFESARQSVGAEIRARAGRGFGQNQGNRRQGPHHSG